MHKYDLDKVSIRELNQALHEFNGNDESSEWTVTNSKGKHAVAVGIDAPININIEGHVGYYCAGMNKKATVTVQGNCGPGVAENMMSGKVHITGSASQYAQRERRSPCALHDRLVRGIRSWKRENS